MNTDSLTKLNPVLLGEGHPSIRTKLSLHPAYLMAGGHQKAQAAAQCQINASWAGLPLIITSLYQSSNSPGMIKISLKGSQMLFFVFLKKTQPCLHMRSLQVQFSMTFIRFTHFWCCMIPVASEGFLRKHLLMLNVREQNMNHW